MSIGDLPSNMGVSALMKINLHDLHAAAVIQYRLVASGLLSDPPQLPDVTRQNEPNDPLLVEIWEEDNTPLPDHVLPTAVQLPSGVRDEKFGRLRLGHLWRRSGITGLARSHRYDYSLHSNNRDIAALTISARHSPALGDEDKVYASMSWIASTRTLTWENETLNMRFTTDTTQDPYSADILAMRVDVARALEAIFLNLEEENDPFCDRDDCALEEGTGLIPVPILQKLLYECDQRQASTEEAEQIQLFETVFYLVTEKSQNAILVQCRT